MNDKLRESLSALMDNEANEIELARILANSDDDVLRQTWSRYHLIGTVQRGESLGPVPVPGDFAAQVSAVISVEGAAKTHSARGIQGVLRPLVSFAVAASVAAVVVVGGQQLNSLDADNTDVPTALAGNVSPVGMVNTLGATPVNASYGTQPLPSRQQANQQLYRDLAGKQLQRYLPQHAQQAALNSPQGLVPYARAYWVEQ